jgi:D-sedoheptulose 7-phosphate isomerase|tara:strand:+ start:774 stop:1334 length:561 start_codon:yes stop_codon:yes gene_type:complete
MSKQIIEDSIFNHSESLNLINKELISSASEIIINAIKAGNNIFWCGNGGSASQANHLSAELVGGMYKDKKSPFKSVCLNVDTAFITAWSNDDSFDNIFSRQLEGLAQSDDILIALSTSGNSNNIINAAKYCNDNSIKIISLTGFDGGILKNLSDININISNNSTQRIQEMHILVGHILCDIVEHSF